MSEPQQTRKKLDFLYQEVLGEVAGITQRLEVVNDGMRQTAVALIAGIDALTETTLRLERLPDDGAKADETVMKNTGRGLNAELLDKLNVSLSETKLELDRLSINTASYAGIALQSARKMAILALAVGALSGAGAAFLLLLTIQ